MRRCASPTTDSDHLQGPGFESRRTHRIFTAKTAKNAKNVAKTITLMSHRTIARRNRRQRRSTQIPSHSHRIFRVGNACVNGGGNPNRHESVGSTEGQARCLPHKVSRVIVEQAFSLLMGAIAGFTAPQLKSDHIEVGVSNSKMRCFVVLCDGWPLCSLCFNPIIQSTSGHEA